MLLVSHQSSPIDLLNLTRKEQESLCSQLGWDFVQFLVREL